MKSSFKKIAYLSGISLLCAGVAFVAVRKDHTFFDSDNDITSRYFIDGTAREDLSQLHTLYIKDGDSELTLVKDDVDLWRLKEHMALPASPAVVRSVLTKLSQTLRVEAKTSKPARYAMLGLSDDKALQLKGLDKNNHLIFDILLGDTPAQRNGMYAKHVDENRTYLISEHITVSPNISLWSDNRTFTPKEQHIVSVKIAPTGTPEYTLRTIVINETQAWSMPNVPEGYSVRGQQPLRDIISSFRLLTTDQLIPLEETSASFDNSPLGHAIITLKDGATIRMDLAGETMLSEDSEKAEETPTVTYAKFSITPPPSEESDDTSKDEASPLYDYSFMQEAAKHHTYTVGTRIIADILKPRADLLIEIDENGKPILKEPQ